ncbi:uncharacterized protein [Drosophila tropicalis]|uniref:uncharacterized protein n=1 Tax=Drosophila tropicalis TaxID=46794 RepID=UPI0035ABF14F
MLMLMLMLMLVADEGALKQCELKVLGRNKIGLNMDVKMKDVKMRNMTHDLRLKNLVLSDNMFEKLPLPTGIYKFRFLYATDGIWRATTETVLEIVEALNLN